jgi:16S rRNA (guanine1207-N2)-methyltransferase
VIDAIVNGLELHFETTSGVFSPTRLDRGSLAMLSCIKFAPNDKILDLGCGYGLIGIYAAKLIRPDRVWMIDNDAIAVRYAVKNCVLNGVEDAAVLISDGFRDIHETNFTKIICNPPYHADFSVPKHFIEKGFNRLAVQGAMHIVTKRRTWYENKLRAIFGRVQIREVDSYLVFAAEKAATWYAASDPRRLSDSGKWRRKKVTDETA